MAVVLRKQLLILLLAALGSVAGSKLILTELGLCCTALTPCCVRVADTSTARSAFQEYMFPCQCPNKIICKKMLSLIMKAFNCYSNFNFYLRERSLVKQFVYNLALLHRTVLICCLEAKESVLFLQSFLLELFKFL